MKDLRFFSTKSRQVFLLLCLLCGSLFGCYSAGVDYDLGWTTRKVLGQVEDAVTGDPLRNGFIIVKEFYGNFVGNEAGEAGNFIPRARLFRFLKSEGSFDIDFDLRASQLELNFVKPGYEVHRFRFKRQFGVGDLRYVAKMIPSSDWSDELVLGVTPLIQNLLLEPGYLLLQPDQLFLGDWLAKQRDANFETE
jgi:hypothetical protein